MDGGNARRDHHPLPPGRRDREYGRPLGGRHGRHEREALVQGRDQCFEREGGRRSRCAPEVPLPESREAPVGLALQEPRVEVGREGGLVGADQEGFPVPGEWAQASHVRHRAFPVRGFPGVGHRCVDRSRLERPEHFGVAGDRHEGRLREVRARDLLEVPPRVDTQAEAAPVDLVDRGDERRLADQHDRAALGDRDGEAPGGAAFRPDRDSGHRHVEPTFPQSFDELRPREGHEFEGSPPLFGVGPGDIDVETPQFTGICSAERRIIAAGSDPERVGVSRCVSRGGPEHRRQHTHRSHGMREDSAV